MKQLKQKKNKRTANKVTLVPKLSAARLHLIKKIRQKVIMQANARYKAEMRQFKQERVGYRMQLKETRRKEDQDDTRIA